MSSTALRNLQPLVGTWQVTGGAEGQVRYEWLPGEQFLLQRVDLVQDGQQIIGLEVIGHLRPFGADPSEELHPRFYDNQGNTLWPGLSSRWRPSTLPRPTRGWPGAIGCTRCGRICWPRRGRMRRLSPPSAGRPNAPDRCPNADFCWPGRTRWPDRAKLGSWRTGRCFFPGRADQAPRQRGDPS